MKARYSITSDYFGLYDETRIIATTDNIRDANFICEALNKALEDRPFIFKYEKICEDYDEILDDKTSIFYLFDNNDT